MVYKLYEKNYTPAAGIDEAVGCFVPGPGKVYLAGEIPQIKTTLVRLLFWLMTAGKARLYYILGEKGEVAHTSYVVGRCFKFPFLKKGEYEIGPCFTAPECRGQGLYGRALGRIVGEKIYENARFYMFVSEDNDASIRGIEKAGFIQTGHVVKTKLLKRYCRK